MINLCSCNAMHRVQAHCATYNSLQLLPLGLEESMRQWASTAGRASIAASTNVSYGDSSNCRSSGRSATRQVASEIEAVDFVRCNEERLV
jgi:hypothetical protein